MARLSGATAEASPDPSVDDPRDSPPFFNTTFSTHRVSPLYVGPEGLVPGRLEALSRRLRDVLVGDVVRGIQVGLQATETSSGQVGPLKAVQLQWFQANTLLGGYEENQSQQGLWIDIRHENAAYAGLLLPGLSTLSVDDTTLDAQGNFIQLPLLLLRMPAALKNVVTDWLAATFDCRVSRMTIGTKTILGVWESWVEAVGIKHSGLDFTVTLAFNAPLSETGDAAVEDSEDELVQDPAAPGLRSMDITISPHDLRRFTRAGAGMQPLKKDAPDPWEDDPRERRRLAGGNSDDGWAWRAKDAKAHPFTEALGRYLSHHLALDLFHPSVRVTQISCSGFVLGQSRLKIVRVGELTDDLSRAAWAFVEQLGERIIKGDQLPQLFSTKFTG